MYKCLLSNWDALERRIRAIIRKLDKYGIPYNYKRGADSVEAVSVSREAVDHTTGTISTIKLGDFPMDVVNYDFSMEELKLGNYHPIAILEHGNNDKNIIYMLDETIPARAAWGEAAGKCEHCGINRYRKTTVILLDNLGNYKQVGKTCLNEYTGIDALSILKAYTDVREIVINDELSCTLRDGESFRREYYDTLETLASCIDVINSKGYEKGETIRIALNKDSYSENGKAMAEKVISFYKENGKRFLDSGDTFSWNIAQALAQEYCKPNGFIAYAFIAYQKEMERMEKEAKRRESAALSQFVGKVGEKVSIKCTITGKYGYESEYGYTTIHIFKDESGNVYKWSTNKALENAIGECLTIAGTIKAHNEYKGEKQTVLTRCKAG